ncbi:S-layer homology domain-containing protein [Paenibacillus mucilaginosus]|uniref:AncA n=1 Tax=Paenibacillus mucilaginosus (strain KNP414) TaxID=1036673 RepID=F8FQS4_PAEMK|nr:S-layer homology domain-containing protein [Paenibacillus mucilaginosus]AEI39254.1 AncA [Paenibacillus mucilaginosus KNP414]MCG7217104.1 S-layer homology domain-containing protein [Paenibacillus mucilaginosus]WDM28261.1 S-layer homology domain-containing protein [Paenibacillus mucilaginosus]
MFKIRSLAARTLPLVLAVPLLFPFGAAPVSAAVPFPDVNPNRHAWALGSIEVMSEKGIVTGYPDGRFLPDQSISKAEWTVMVYRLFDKYRPNLYAYGSDKVTAYADVPPLHWAYRPILDMYDASFYIGGFGEDLHGELAFRPEMRLNRLQLAQILGSLFHDRLMNLQMSQNDACSLVASLKDVPSKFLPDTDAYAEAQADGRYKESGFMDSEKAGSVYPTLFLGTGTGNCVYGDDDLSNTQATALASLQASGIMSADEAGYFRPLDAVSRAEAVTILDRIYLYLRGLGYSADYSSIELEAPSEQDGSTGSGSSGGTGSTSGSGTTVPPASGGGTGGSPSAGNGASVPPAVIGADGTGSISRNVLRKGEIETTVRPNGRAYLQFDLESDWKVDLYVIVDGQIGFVRQEDLPMAIPVDGVTSVVFRTQQREKPAGAVDNVATLTTKFLDEMPSKGKKKS